MKFKVFILIYFFASINVYSYAVDQMREQYLEGGNFALQTKVTKYGLNGKEITLLSAFGAGDKTYYQEINDVLKDQDLVIYVSLGNVHERMGNITHENNDFVQTINGIHKACLELMKTFDLSYIFNELDFSSFKHAGIKLADIQEIKDLKQDEITNLVDFNNNFIKEISPMRPYISKALIADFYLHAPNIFESVARFEIKNRLENFLNALDELLKDQNFKKITIIADPIFDFFVDEIIRRNPVEKLVHTWLTAFSYKKSPFIKTSTESSLSNISSLVKHYQKGNKKITLLPFFPFANQDYFQNVIKELDGDVFNAAWLNSTQGINQSIASKFSLTYVGDVIKHYKTVEC